jgi:hypothetical protein
MPRVMPEFESHLDEQCAQHGIERMPDVVVLVFLAQVWWAEAHREQRAAQAIDDVGQRLARRQLAPTHFERALLRGTPALARSPQLGDDRREIKRLARLGRRRCIVCRNGCRLVDQFAIA